MLLMPSSYTYPDKRVQAEIAFMGVNETTTSVLSTSLVHCLLYQLPELLLKMQRTVTWSPQQVCAANAGSGKPSLQRNTELEHRRQVPVPTERRPPCVPGPVSKAVPPRYQLAEAEPKSHQVYNSVPLVF